MQIRMIILDALKLYFEPLMSIWTGSRKESGIEQAAKRFIKGKGFLLKIQGAKGWPDRILVLPENKHIWIEFKTKIGTLHPLQIYVHNELRALGHKVEIVRDLHEFKKVVLNALDAL